MPDRQQEAQRDDVALLMASAAGDRGAYREFVERHQAALLRFARAISGSTTEAEEAMQQTFVSAWLSAGTFRGEGPARGWLFRIARNAQNRTHRLRVGEPAEHEGLEELGCRAGWNANQAPLSEVIENREWVQHALHRLDADDREVLLLVEIEGFSLGEASETLALSLPALKSRLHRARLRLVAALRKDNEDAQ